MSIDLNQTSVREIFASNDIDVIRDLCGDEAGADIMSAGIVRKIKGLGRLLTAWAFVLVRIHEIWQIGRVVVRDFLRRTASLFPLAWDLVNVCAPGAFRPVGLTRAASGAWLYSLSSAVMPCCPVRSNHSAGTR